MAYRANTQFRRHTIELRNSGHIFKNYKNRAFQNCVFCYERMRKAEELEWFVGSFYEAARTLNARNVSSVICIAIFLFGLPLYYLGGELLQLIGSLWCVSLTVLCYTTNCHAKHCSKLRAPFAFVVTAWSVERILGTQVSPFWSLCLRHRGKTHRHLRGSW